MQRMTREQALDFKHAESWKLLCQEIQELINANTSKLLSCGSDELVQLQESIRALRFCMNLPDIIAEREE